MGLGAQSGNRKAAGAGCCLLQGGPVALRPSSQAQPVGLARLMAPLRGSILLPFLVWGSAAAHARHAHPLPRAAGTPACSPAVQAAPKVGARLEGALLHACG